MSALVQGKSGSGTAATLALAFSSNNTAGNTLIAFSPQLYGGSGGTVSDSAGNTWQAAPTNGIIWYALNCKAGANTITFSLSGAGYIEGTVGEVSAASAVDQSAGPASGTSTSPSSGNVTTTVANELIVGGVSGSGTLTPGSGYTAVAANPGGHILEVQTQTSAGAIAATGSFSASTAWYASITTFKPAGTAHTANLTDTYTLTDRGLVKTPQKAVSESYTLTDRGLVKTPQKALLESFSVVESLARAVTRALTDALTLSDNIARTPEKAVAETFTVTDRGLVRTPQKVVSDAFTVSDRGLGRQIGKALAESFSLVESLARSMTRALSDSVLVAETIARSVARSLAESFSLAELFAATKTKVLAFIETFSLSDSISRLTSRSVNDAIAVTDGLFRQISRGLAESFSLAEVFAASKTKVLAFVEAFSLSDSIGRLTGRSVSDTLAVSETVSRATGRNFTENFTLVDSLARAIARSVAEAFSLLDTFLTGNSIGASDALRRFVAQIWQRLWPVAPISRSFAAIGDTMIYCDPKDAEAVEDFELDWSAAITPDTIASSSWELPAPLTAAAQGNTTTTATVRLSGGVAGSRYIIKNLVVLASGQTKAQSLLVPVS